jgi:hypothetical protein
MFLMSLLSGEALAQDAWNKISSRLKLPVGASVSPLQPSSGDGKDAPPGSFFVDIKFVASDERNGSPHLSDGVLSLIFMPGGDLLLRSLIGTNVPGQFIPLRVETVVHAHAPATVDDVSAWLGHLKTHLVQANAKHLKDHAAYLDALAARLKASSAQRPLQARQASPAVAVTNGSGAPRF